MKAAIHTRYGPPEIVELRDIPKPAPEENEVLIKVYASTVNRTDCGFRSAEYFVSRLFSGLFRPKHRILGCEFAGVVEEIGINVASFRVGDKVFGFNDNTFGGHAEYIAVDEHSPLAILPENLDFHTAAPMTEGAHYALNIIRASNIQKGQNALVYGATGAIGSAAVPIAQPFWCERNSCGKY